jgi:HD-GYP domain-containing protein (c-di-GMP phosphodiesterase class II)
MPRIDALLLNPVYYMQPKILYPESAVLVSKLVQEDKVRTMLDKFISDQRSIYEHSLRVAILSLDMGFENQLDQPDLSYLGYAGLLHDNGKASLPADILSKRKSLNSTDRALLNEHARLGFLALESFEPEIVKQIVVAHHEYQNKPYPRNGIDRRKTGRGGPDRRSNRSQVGALAQILAVADMFDALTSQRSYKEALSKSDTETLLREQFTGDALYIDQVLRRYAD